MEKKFIKFAVNSDCENYSALVKREGDLYSHESDNRSPFERDYNRIIHSTAYRRLKHKTQVFYNIENDHICTRMEHVMHVESVSYSIADRLGLNVELTRAIASGHDLGHAPFGHYGEKVIESIYKRYFKSPFFHEKNGLYYVDNIELLQGREGVYNNLNLTYAVRDGIISHCGEVDLNCLKPRKEFIDLKEFNYSGQYNPVTFEGCVVKISDKIAYVGRDIEDALSLGFLDERKLEKLNKIVCLGCDRTVNTTNIMSAMINDVCQNSTPEEGIRMSSEYSDKLNKIKEFNYEHIYHNERFSSFKKYAKLIIEDVFKTLLKCYGKNIAKNIMDMEQTYPLLMAGFSDFLERLSDLSITERNKKEQYKNKRVYGDLSSKDVFVKACIDYISGMTDRFAVKVLEELITY